MAAEVAGTGVTANAVCPSFVRTPMTERTLERISEKTGRSREEALATLEASTPLGRLLEPEEVAEAVWYLASTWPRRSTVTRSCSTGRSELVSLDVVDGVATVTLDRPKRLNALTFEVYADLRDFFQGLPERADVRAVVITGRGRASAPAATSTRSSARSSRPMPSRTSSSRA